MTFKTNNKRINRLLPYWRLGTTVSQTGIITRIPSSSVGYYFSRFKKDTEKYGKRGDRTFQDPPQPEPIDLAAEIFSWNIYLTKILDFVHNEDYGKANEFLTFLKLYDEFKNRHTKRVEIANDYINQKNKLAKSKENGNTRIPANLLHPISNYLSKTGKNEETTLVPTPTESIKKKPDTNPTEQIDLSKSKVKTRIPAYKLHPPPINLQKPEKSKTFELHTSPTVGNKKQPESKIERLTPEQLEEARRRIERMKEKKRIT